MAKANKSNDLSIFMKDLADTIRQKTGVDVLINPQDFSSQISSLGGGAALEVEDITVLTTKQINKLDCGDIVNKDIDGNKHAYIVSYKEDEVGICLTYVDAENVETVSYDYIDNEWVYNSTDYTSIVTDLSDYATKQELSDAIASAITTTLSTPV